MAPPVGSRSVVPPVLPAPAPVTEEQGERFIGMALLEVLEGGQNGDNSGKTLPAKKRVPFADGVPPNASAGEETNASAGEERPSPAVPTPTAVAQPESSVPPQDIKDLFNSCTSLERQGELLSCLRYFDDCLNKRESMFQVALPEELEPFLSTSTESEPRLQKSQLKLAHEFQKLNCSIEKLAGENLYWVGELCKSTVSMVNAGIIRYESLDGKETIPATSALAQNLQRIDARIVRQIPALQGKQGSFANRPGEAKYFRIIEGLVPRIEKEGIETTDEITHEFLRITGHTFASYVYTQLAIACAANEPLRSKDLQMRSVTGFLTEAYSDWRRKAPDGAECFPIRDLYEFCKNKGDFDLSFFSSFAKQKGIKIDLPSWDKEIAERNRTRSEKKNQEIEKNTQAFASRQQLIQAKNTEILTLERAIQLAQQQIQSLPANRSGRIGQGEDLSTLQQRVTDFSQQQAKIEMQLALLTSLSEQQALKLSLLQEGRELSALKMERDKIDDPDLVRFLARPIWVGKVGLDFSDRPYFARGLTHAVQQAAPDVAVPQDRSLPAARATPSSLPPPTRDDDGDEVVFGVDASRGRGGMPLGVARARPPSPPPQAKAPATSLLGRVSDSVTRTVMKRGRGGGRP